MRKNCLLIGCTIIVGVLAGLLMSACTGGKKSAETDGVKAEGAGKEKLKENQPADSVAAENEPVKVDDKNGLTLYYPRFSRIELVTGKRPSEKNDSVIMIASAAFTSKLLDDFNPENIVGNYVSAGDFHEGAKDPRITGAFYYFNGHFRFSYKDLEENMKKAKAYKGSAFSQEMLIHEGEIVPHVRPDDNVNEFRALAMVGGRLAVIDSQGEVKFGDFLKKMVQIGVREALYMDMGAGWNYSWYRQPDGKVKEIHSFPTPYATNWLTFYK